MERVLVKLNTLQYRNFINILGMQMQVPNLINSNAIAFKQ